MDDLLVHLMDSCLVELMDLKKDWIMVAYLDNDSVAC